jgi:hypothetical protein
MMKRILLAAAIVPAAVPWAAASPLDAAADVPAIRFQSAFADYRPYDEAPRDGWREVNRVVDEAARKSTGGHAGGGVVPAAPAPAPASPDAGGGRGGGHHHGAGTAQGGAK